MLNVAGEMKWLENLVGVIAVIYPLSAIPQIIEIWMNKNVEGVSLLTWSLFLVLTIPLIIYAIVKKDRKLTIMWSLWSLCYVAIISGIILYG